VRILNDSLERHIGKGLRDFTNTTCDEPECWDDIHTSTRYALHSNGASNGLDGSVNNYGNFAALGAFEMTFSQFTRLSAGRMANPGLDQEGWSQVLQRMQSMEKQGFLQSYKGFRCTVNQKRFFIRDAMVRQLACFDNVIKKLLDHYLSLIPPCFCRFGIASTTRVSITDKLCSLIEIGLLSWIFSRRHMSRQ
jgi:hypothetical protein